MKNLIIGIITVIVIAVLCGGFIMYRMMTGPIYRPGDISKNGQMDNLKPPAQNKDGKWLVEEGIELNYFKEGKGRKVLIIHGGPGMPYVEAWPGLDKLTENYEFYYYDQRGSGLSTRPVTSLESKSYKDNMELVESKLGLSAQVKDIERIRQIIGEEKLIIVGHSFGGTLATLYASEFPDRMESLILVTPASILRLPSKVKGLFDGIEENLPESELVGYKDFMKRYFDYKNIFSKTDQDLIDINNELGRYFGMINEKKGYKMPEFGKPGGWMIQAIYNSMGMRHDYIKDIGELDIPTLIIHANDDIVQELEGSRMYMEIFPDAKLEVIEDAGHMVFYDRPDEFYSVVKEFLSN